MDIAEVALAVPSSISASHIGEVSSRYAAIGLTFPPAFSSKVTMSWLLWRGAYRACVSKCLFHPTLASADEAIVHA